MAVTIDLPANVEQRLRAASPSLDAEAKETLLVELYRQDRITRYELSLALGLDRFATDAILKQRQATKDLPTAKEIEGDLVKLRHMVGQ